MTGDSGDSEPPGDQQHVLLQTIGQQLRLAGLSRDDLPENSSGARKTASGFYFHPPLDGSQCSTNQGPQLHTPESDGAPRDVDQLPTMDTRSASRFLWRANEVASVPANSPLSFDNLIAWSRSFFDHWHPAFPFLHAPSILHYFGHITQEGFSERDDASAFQLTICRALMSISLADRRQTESSPSMPPVPTSLVFSSFTDAINNVGRALTTDTSVLSLQAVVSVQLFLISMLRYNAASRLEGLAVRMAVHLGLHRCPAQIPDMLGKEMELRKRLFWSIYCIDRCIFARLGFPLAIRDDDIDVCYPGEEHHEEGKQEALEHDSRLDLLHFMTRHAGIRGSIMKLRQSSRACAHANADYTRLINTNLTKWWNDVEESLESNDSSRPSGIGQHQMMGLSILKYESVMTLNRYIIATSKTDSSYNEALQNCISAARGVINTLHKALNTFQAAQGAGEGRPPGPGEQHPPALVWPLFTWNLWMSAFILVHAAAEGQIQSTVVERFTDRSLEVLQHLMQRGTVWPNACAAGIRTMGEQAKGRTLGPAHSNKRGMTPETAQLKRVKYSGDRWQDQHHRQGLATPSLSNQGHDPAQRLGRHFPETNTRPPPSASSGGAAEEGMPLVPYLQTPPETRDQVHGKNNFNTTSNMRNSSTLWSEDPITTNTSANTTSSSSQPESYTAGVATYPSDMQHAQWDDLLGQHGPIHQFPAVFTDFNVQESTDLFYGSDIPFWMGDDQWGALTDGSWS